MDGQGIQIDWNLLGQLLRCETVVEMERLIGESGVGEAEVIELIAVGKTQLEQQGNAAMMEQLDRSLALVEEVMAVRSAGARVQENVAGTSEAAKFLRETLLLIMNVQGNPQQVYPVWGQQQDRLNGELLGVMPQVMQSLLMQNPGQGAGVAALFRAFGNLMQQFPLGKPIVNMELAIAAYEQALTVMTQSAMPIEWGTTTTNLASAYCERIKGDQADNVEQAIACYDRVLTVVIETEMPLEWATIIMNLANAYYKRIRGDKAENIENAITGYKQALTVMTETVRPFEWAAIIMNLASAYHKRIRGDKAENIENAIVAYKQALTVMTEPKMPVEWATTTMNLANAYFDRIRGDKAENIENAISGYQQALTVRRETAMPLEWATTMINLATAYRHRIKGDKTENIENAILAYEQALRVMTKMAMPIELATNRIHLATAYRNRLRGDKAENIENAITGYQQALTVMTKAAMPMEWATAMMHLANAYFARIQGDKSENIENAIANYKEALTVRTKMAMPIEWANTMHNLAAAYSDRVRGNKVENIESAISACKQSLTVRTETAMPVEWAQTMNNLAVAYSERIRGDEAENIENMIASYKSSLTIFTPETFPDDCRRTGRFLANLYSDQTRWTEAASTYKIALKASEICYQRSDFLDSKSSELSTTADLPRRAAYAYAKTGDLPKAIETLEQGRARGLSESLNRDRSDLKILLQQNPTLHNQYQNITQQLRDLETQQRNPNSSLTRAEIQIKSQSLDQQLQNTIAQIRQVPGYEDFLKAPTFPEIQKAVTTNSPLTYLVTTPNGSMALTVTVEAIEVLWLNDLTEETLQEILYGPAEGKELSRYLGAYQAFRNDSKANYPAWRKEIYATTNQLWDLLMGPIVQQLKTLGFDRAALIPTGLLSLLPLHAAWTAPDETKPTDRRYALDHLHLTYAPNAKSLTYAQSIADQVQADSILAIDNPTNDEKLQSSTTEIAHAIATFPQNTVLLHDQATVQSVRSKLSEAAIVHFSCHGTANLNDPLNSGLSMSDGLLTLRDLFDLKLADNKGIRLAILSACETGLPGLENIDEVVSLPIGLMQAGVAGVISSLWSVNELSTMMLLTRFYHLWRKDGLEPAIALHQAQQWMAHTTDGEKAKYCGLITQNPNDRTYAHPFHWAAFSYLGVQLMKHPPKP
jgi:CHAT domain-containing protein/putative heme iron utilization protein